MKNIKYIILSLTLLIVTSCGDDDFSIAYVDDEVKTALVGTLQLDRTIAAPSTQIGFSVTIPQSFTAESKVQVTAKRQISVVSNSFAQIIATVTIPAGATTGTGVIEMPGNTGDTSDWNGIADYAEIAITGLALTQPENGSIDDPFVMTSEPISVTALQYNASWMAPATSTLKVIMDWEGPYDTRNFSLYMWNTDDGFYYEGSTSSSGARFRGDFFNNPANEVHPDGNYAVEIDVPASYAGTGDVPYYIQLVHPDGTTDFYPGTLLNSESLAGTFFDVVYFTKTTDGDGNVTFTSSSAL